VTITCHCHVNLNDVDAKRNAVLDGRQGVLWRSFPIPPMRNDQDLAAGGIGKFLENLVETG
jgi:hypothetical protein